MEKILITGGAGFIGTNLVFDLVQDPRNKIILFDNLSRPGVEKNLKFILSQGYKNLAFIKGDIRNYKLLKEITRGVKSVVHLAAQVAVTSSVIDPVYDFQVNATGTLYLLEACRQNAKNAIFLYASTNKVYGDLAHLKIKETSARYELVQRPNGISENELLDFHSPYGCSKGAADQYVRDYARIYGMKTIVFRQSCIYGPYQHGNVDQGWVVHFILQNLAHQSVTIYGDGKQVRDLLHVKDLIDAYKKAMYMSGECVGKVFNIGGGTKNSFSLLELISLIEKTTGNKMKYVFDNWRPGDQKVFISENKKIAKEMNWKPKISAKKGVMELISWIKSHPEFYLK
ncbi:MAG TPA: GDP-mannose 4,6-dehydratase [bacterium]|nr:GDP-mannose 4,6-dehydratase [bacterium]HPO51447.1 GDP-mannose 4,6-dehydratase [bacterium]